MKERHVISERAASPFVVHDAVIPRALSGDQSAQRQVSIACGTAALERRAGLGNVTLDVVLAAGEQRLQGSARRIYQLPLPHDLHFAQHGRLPSHHLHSH